LPTSGTKAYSIDEKRISALPSHHRDGENRYPYEGNRRRLHADEESAEDPAENLPPFEPPAP
jgi:hypothetical protein